MPAQTLPLTVVAPLSSTVSESSGLIPSKLPGHWWTHNDSGGAAELYCIDSTGAVVRTVTVLGATNVDWEELTADGTGHVYIGDFGNNGNNRQDLVIYQLPHPDSSLLDSLVASGIYFSYADQTAFPPADSLLHYDMEAMVAWGDSLYLFSKNRTVPFDGYTRLHVLPAQPGTYVTQPIDSFFAGAGPMQAEWICGAALNPDGTQLMLVSYGQGWLFSCYDGQDFFGGSAVRLSWPLRQMEAAAWSGPDTLFLTDERFNGSSGGDLHRAVMTHYSTMPVANLGPDTLVSFPPVVLYAPGQPGATYLWSTGETGDSIVALGPWVYSVTVTAPNGCVASDSMEVFLTVGNETDILPGLQATVSQTGPGADAVLHLRSAQSGLHAWELFDLDGRRLANGFGALTAGQPAALPLSPRLGAGIYVLQCTGTGGFARVKLALR
jgi:hypothetical protein